MPWSDFEPKFRPCPNRVDQGLSTLELVISVAIILVISAVAIPTLSYTLRVYQLNDAANQLAGMVKFTRFQAIRRRSPTPSGTWTRPTVAPRMCSTPRATPRRSWRAI